MDTIGQFLTNIRNAGMARLEKVDVPASNLRKSIADILTQEGYLKSFKVAKDSKQGIMRLYIRYNEDGTPKLLNVQRVSKPGRRIYLKCDDLKNVRSGYGMSIISTSKGLMTNRKAKQHRLGGEVICEVW
ncbi:MAG: 30S ribosomal protein S8 [Bdellovibrio sp. 28-41-41]|jgi:small subunit ribosomal protein S8|nr:MAG: 30S ribosomal protein S8 [Bdellovibrio sp. 28-41-41]